VWHASTVKSILCSVRISGQRAYEPTAPRAELHAAKTAAQNTITAAERLLGRARQVAAP
jgi:hypothetical protein